MASIGYRGTERWVRAVSAAALMAVGMAGLVAVDAKASTAKVVPGDCIRYGCAPNTVSYEAAPGERNRLQITPSPGGFTFRDSGAAIQAGSGCVTQSSGVFCRDDSPFLFVRLGDGDDHLDASAAERVTASGDSGADVLLGGSRTNFLLGGSGSDELRGAAGSDRLVGDGVLRSVASDDPRAPLDAPPTPDIIDGRGGVDSVSYAGRKTEVSVDLARDIGGAASEDDRLLSIESATGGAGGDSLRGDGQNNSLDGLGGNDVLNGAGGSDELLGGQGNDLVRGGAGNDVLEASGRYGIYGGGTPGRDRLLCSSGSDEVKSAEMTTYVSPECERVETGGRLGTIDAAFQLRLPLRSLRSPSVAIETVLCVGMACRATMSYRLARRVGKLPARTLIARQSVRLNANGRRRCQRGVRLTRRGRRLLRSRRQLLVRFTIREASTGVRAAHTGFLTRLVLGGERPEDPPPSDVGKCFGS